MAVIATLPFDTVTGPDDERINYRLDILDDSSVATTPLALIGDGTSPVKIEWLKDDDIYKPIVGSKMNINLWVEDESTAPPDLNTGTPFQYEVRLKRVVPQRQASSTGGLVYVGDVNDTFGLQTGETWRITVSNSSSTTQTAANRITGQANSGLNVGDSMLTIGSGGTANSGLTVTRFGAASDGALLVFGSGVGGASLETGDGIFFPASEVDEWCGFIFPNDTKEAVNTFPFPISFTATDRLGALGQQAIIYENVEHDPTLIGYIGRALRQTGLDLPLYVDSGIRTADGDPLTSTQASLFSFFDEDSTPERLGDRATIKESLEGILETFNCRIFQSRGLATDRTAWYIVNCSTYGDADDTNVDFAQYIPDTGMTGRDFMNRFPGDTGYVPTANIEEYVASTNVVISSLRQNLDGTSSSNLSVNGQDILLSLRQPYGSIEARPENLFQDPLITNYDFRDEADGYGGNVLAAYDGTDTNITEDGNTNLYFSTNTDDFLTGTRAIATNRNVFEISDRGALWFENTTEADADRNSPTNITFNWKYNNHSDGRNIRIPFRIRVDLDTPITVRELNTTSITTLLAGPADSTISTIYWNFNLERWDTFAGNNLQRTNILGRSINRTGTINTTTASSDAENEWNEVSIEVDSYATYRGFFDSVEVPGGNIVVEFYFPQAYRGNDGKRQAASDTGDFNVLIDDVVIGDVFNDDVNAPIYEYRQSLHTETLTYEPSFISSGPSSFRQFLNDSSGDPVTQYWPKEGSVADQTTLERLVTGRKLRDYKQRLRYLEANLINRTTTPLSLFNKINVNYNNYDGNGVYILNGGSWDVKQNTFDIAGYSPNNDTFPDTGDVYTPYNVDLVAGRFPGRRNGNRYILGVVVRGTNPDTGAVVNDSVSAVTELIDVTAPAGTVIERDIVITPLTGFVSTGAVTQRPDATGAPRPTSVEFSRDADGEPVFMPISAGFNQPTSATDTTPRSVIGARALPVKITIPDDDDFEQLHIDFPVVPFVAETPPGMENVAITVVNRVANTERLGSHIVEVGGSAGNTRTVSFTLTPSDPASFEVLPSDVRLNTADISSNLQVASYTEQRVGNSLLVEILYDIPSGGETGVTIVLDSLTGGASAISTTANPQFSNFVEIGQNVANSNLRLITPTIVHHRGGETSREGGQFFIESNEGYFLTASNFSLDTGGTDAGISDVSFIQVEDDLVEVRYFVTIGGSSNTSTTPTTLSINTTTTTAVEPYSFTFVANNLGVQGGSISFVATGTGTHRIGYNEGTAAFDSFQLRVSSADGMAFAGTSSSGTGTFTDTSNEVAIDVNEASVINTTRIETDVTDGRVVLQLNEQLVTVAQSTPFLDNGDLFFDLDINPSFLPSVGGNYVIDVNVSGAAGLGVANTGSFVVDTLNIASGGGLPSVGFTANGRIDVIEGTSANTPGSVDFLLPSTVSYNNGANGNVTTTGATLSLPSGITRRSGFWLMVPEGATSPILDSIELVQMDTAAASTSTMLQTFPIILSGPGAGISEPNVYSYLDFNGERRIVTLAGSATSNICVIGTDFTSANNNIEDLSIVAEPNPPTTGSGTCANPTSSGSTYANEAGNSTTTNGLTFQVLSGAPPSGTPNTTITFRT